MSGDRSGQDRGGRSARYCTACGSSLDPAVNYCPNCGTASGTDLKATDRRSRGTTSTRQYTRTTPSRRQHTQANRTSRRQHAQATDRDALERRLSIALENGWELEHDLGDRAVVVRRTFGSVTDHLVIALVTVWWTMGIGNALYGAYRYFGDAERQVIQAATGERDGATAIDTGTDSRSRMLARLTATVCWLVTAVLAGIGSLTATSAVTLVTFGLAAAFAIAGVASLPSVRQRLDRRRSVLTNGRVHSVDERAVVAPDRPCSACADTIDRGVERTYRNSIYLLGIPLSTSAGHNYYCRRCANAEQVAESASITQSSNRDESAPDRNPDIQGPQASEPERDRA